VPKLGPAPVFVFVAVLELELALALGWAQESELMFLAGLERERR
jgi:hypothetical protein